MPLSVGIWGVYTWGLLWIVHIQNVLTQNTCFHFSDIFLKGELLAHMVAAYEKLLNSFQAIEWFYTPLVMRVEISCYFNYWKRSFRGHDLLLTCKQVQWGSSPFPCPWNVPSTHHPTAGANFKDSLERVMGNWHHLGAMLDWAHCRALYKPLRFWLAGVLVGVGISPQLAVSQNKLAG